MLLESLTIKNFRCHADLVNVPIHKLTVFIGENDAGKTALLDAIEILLTEKRPNNTDYHNLEDGTTTQTITISGNFRIEEHDLVKREKPNLCHSDGSALTLTKIFPGTGKCKILGLGFSDERFNSFDKQNAPVQKELLSQLDIIPGANTQKRIEQFQEAVESGLLIKQETAFEASFSEVSNYLPDFQRTYSKDYNVPDVIIAQTLKSAVERSLYHHDEVTQERTLIPQLQEVENLIKVVLRHEIDKIKDFISKSHPKVKSVSVESRIDFSRSLQNTILILDTGTGMKPVDAYGEGTKKKLWMGLLDWQIDVQKKFQDRSIIRAFDEPDINLDYESERKLFANILSTTHQLSSKTQSIVCTHAVTMVDRAPAQSINLIKTRHNGSRFIDHINSDDSDVQDFLSTVGRSVGISNSSLFYERAYLVVEGESELNSLPILYKNLYGRSLIEDGIVLVCLHTCGAWKSVLQILLHNRSEITILLLDQDCVDSESNKITEERLRSINYPRNFIDNGCIFIGEKEFEDAFSNSDIVAMFNECYPRSDQKSWCESHIKPLRKREKFSEELKKILRSHCIETVRSEANKPQIAERLAKHCTAKEQIPHKIIKAFNQVRIRSGCENNNPQEEIKLEKHE